MPGQVQLVPWKSEYKNENDITVPLHATLVCLLALIVIVVIGMISAIGHSQKKLPWQTILSSM